MTSESRKATDVILELESKIDKVLGYLKSLDFNFKILSNRLNDALLDKAQATAPKITVEAIQNPLPKSPNFAQIPAGDPERNIPILSESALPQENSPQGFRRTSRPETFAGNNAHLSQTENIKMPLQIPKQAQQVSRTNNSMIKPPPGRSASDIINFEENSASLKSSPSNDLFTEKQSIPPSAQGQIPVMQRVVDKNGKSIFLADVEIMDLSNNQVLNKTRTNATGKWMASLNLGKYRVTVKKRESLSKDKLKIESYQDITVDGSQSKLDLPMMIIK